LPRNTIVTLPWLAWVTIVMIAPAPAVAGGLTNAIVRGIEVVGVGVMPGVGTDVGCITGVGCAPVVGIGVGCAPAAIGVVPGRVPVCAAVGLVPLEGRLVGVEPGVWEDVVWPGAGAEVGRRVFCCKDAFEVLGTICAQRNILVSTIRPITVIPIIAARAVCRPIVEGGTWLHTGKPVWQGQESAGDQA